jgi:hypothetical protein
MAALPTTATDPTLPTPGIGALPTAVGQTYPTYGIESQQLPEEYNIQTDYGTAALPAFEWARRIQTGEATVQESFDQTAAERIAEASPEELEAEGISPETQAMIAGAIKSGAQTLTSAAMVGEPFLQTPMRFGERFVEEGLSYLPESMVGAPTPDIASQLQHTPGNLMVESSLATDMANSGVRPGTGNFQTVGGNTYVPMDAAGVNAYRLANPVSANAAIQPPGTFGFSGSNAVAGGYDGSIFGPPVEATGGGTIFSGAKNWLGRNTTAGVPTLSGLGFNFAIGAGMNLLMGMKPKEALKGAAISTAGYGVGFLVGGPVGGAIGSAVAGIVSKGSVICSELHRQGEISDSIYRITNYYCATKLTLTHIKGYHFWAVPVVKRLERGKGVKTWKFVYNHWANHIAYKAGVRKKFDVCGWAISNTLETLSLGIGKIYEATSEKRRLGYANS